MTTIALHRPTHNRQAWSTATRPASGRAAIVALVFTLGIAFGSGALALATGGTPGEQAPPATPSFPPSSEQVLSQHAAVAPVTSGTSAEPARPAAPSAPLSSEQILSQQARAAAAASPE